MTTPENPLVTMTAKGIEDMIGKAIAPFVEDNRKLRLAFGYATAIASEALDEPAEEIQTRLLGGASQYLQTIPPNTPTDLLSMVGVKQWRTLREENKPKPTLVGDRAHSMDLQQLEDRLETLYEELHEWFQHFYGQGFLHENEGVKEPPQFKRCLTRNDGITRAAWRVQQYLGLCIHHSFDWGFIQNTEGMEEI